MAKQMNHARHTHRGRATEAAFQKPKKRWHSSMAAKGGTVRSLSDQERARWAAENGYAVA